MKNKSKEGFAARQGNWIFGRLEKIESNLAMVISIGILLKMFSDMSVDFILLLAFSALSISYFLSAFAISRDKNCGAIEKFIHLLVSWGCSVSVNGIMFWMMNWQGYQGMLQLSSIALIISLVVLLFLKKKKNYTEWFNERYLIRLGVIGVIGIVMYFLPVQGEVKSVQIEKPQVEQSE